MAEIRKRTPHVFGTPPSLGGSGDPSASTALGCFVGIKASLKHKTGSDTLSGIRIGVQGLGNVGFQLCGLLSGAGASLIVSDVRADRVQACSRAFNTSAVAPDDIYGAPLDVYAPCALGGTLNMATIPVLRAGIVAGAANNQLATPEDGMRLRARGILYAPDYVVNGGGMIQLAAESTRVAADEIRGQIEAIGTTLQQVYERAERDVITANEAADRMAEGRLTPGP